jgi:hypothetical protein
MLLLGKRLYCNVSPKIVFFLCKMTVKKRPAMYRSTNLKKELCMTVVCIMLVCNVPARKYYASQEVFNDL